MSDMDMRAMAVTHSGSPRGVVFALVRIGDQLEQLAAQSKPVELETVLGVVGDVDPEEVAESIQKASTSRRGGGAKA